MIIVTGQRNEKHVTSWQDRMLNQGAFGEDSYVLNIGQKMAAETYSNNEIRIRDGALVHQGCLSVIQKGTYDAVTIQNGTQGMKRIDLIVARYTKNAETQVEDMAWTVIQGTPDASSPSVPSYTTGDIQDGDLTVDMPMYQVHLDGINIDEVTAAYETMPTMQGLASQVSELNRNIDILKSHDFEQDGRALKVSMNPSNLTNGAYDGFYSYGNYTAGAPSNWSGFMIAGTAFQGSGYYHIKYAFTYNGEIYYMVQESGTGSLITPWTKIS